MATKEYSGNAPNTTLSSGINSSATSFQVADGTGYPTGGTGNFWVEIGFGLSTAEKIKCSARTGNTFTVAASGRGGDSTTAVSHNANEIVRHVFTREDAFESNDHINNAANDHHSQYLNTTRHDVTARHQPGSVPTATSIASLGNSAAGTAATFTRGDHTHGFPASSTYTPSWTVASGTPPAIGNGELNGRHITVGKLVWVYIQLVCGTTTTFGTGSPWFFSLPPGLLALHEEQPINAFITVAGKEYIGIGKTNAGTNNLNVLCQDDSPATITANGVGPTYPDTWTAFPFNFMEISGWVEIQ